MMLFVDKHIEKVDDALHGSGNGEGNGGSDKAPSVPTREWSSKDKDPIEKCIDK